MKIRELVRVALAVALGMSLAAEARTVKLLARDSARINQAVQLLGRVGGGTLLLTGNQPIAVRESIVLNVDNVTIEGEGIGATVLRLADGANCPVFVIGDPAAAPAVVRRNVFIRNLSIDGNRAGQTRETDPDNEALRNNGISLRRVESCGVERVAVANCRSGGIVAELGCRFLVVRHIQASGSEFDGIAGYETIDSIFSDLLIRDCVGAGLSFDLDFNHNLLSNIVIAECGDVGVFMRRSRGNAFAGMQIRQCGSHGIFLAQTDLDTTTPAAENSFAGCTIAGNGGAGLYVANASCVNNALTGSQLLGNAGGALVDHSSTGVLQAANNLE